MAAPSKLTPETQDRIATMIRAGNPTDLAARVAGIHPSTYDEWMARGLLPGRANVKHRAFRAAVEQARAENEAILANRIAKAAASGSWRAACWLLERQYPERWSAGRARDGAGEVERRPNAAASIRDELAQRREARGEPASEAP
jgi:hypothetical protein